MEDSYAGEDVGIQTSLARPAEQVKPRPQRYGNQMRVLDTTNFPDQNDSDSFPYETTPGVPQSPRSSISTDDGGAGDVTSIASGDRMDRGSTASPSGRESSRNFPEPIDPEMFRLTKEKHQDDLEAALTNAKEDLEKKVHVAKKEHGKLGSSYAQLLQIYTNLWTQWNSAEQNIRQLSTTLTSTTLDRDRAWRQLADFSNKLKRLDQNCVDHQRLASDLKRQLEIHEEDNRNVQNEPFQEADSIPSNQHKDEEMKDTNLRLIRHLEMQNRLLIEHESKFEEYEKELKDARDFLQTSILATHKLSSDLIKRDEVMNQIIDRASEIVSNDSHEIARALMVSREGPSMTADDYPSRGVSESSYLSYQFSRKNSLEPFNSTERLSNVIEVSSISRNNLQRVYSDDSGELRHSTHSDGPQDVALSRLPMSPPNAVSNYSDDGQYLVSSPRARDSISQMQMVTDDSSGNKNGNDHMAIEPLVNTLPLKKQPISNDGIIFRRPSRYSSEQQIFVSADTTPHSLPAISPTSIISAQPQSHHEVGLIDIVGNLNDNADRSASPNAMEDLIGTEAASLYSPATEDHPRNSQPSSIYYSAQSALSSPGHEESISGSRPANSSRGSATDSTCIAYLGITGAGRIASPSQPHYPISQQDSYQQASSERGGNSSGLRCDEIQTFPTTCDSSSLRVVNVSCLTNKARDELSAWGDRHIFARFIRSESLDINDSAKASASPKELSLDSKEIFRMITLPTSPQSGQGRHAQIEGTVEPFDIKNSRVPGTADRGQVQEKISCEYGNSRIGRDGTTGTVQDDPAGQVSPVSLESMASSQEAQASDGSSVANVGNLIPGDWVGIIQTLPRNISRLLARLCDRLFRAVYAITMYRLDHDFSWLYDQLLCTAIIEVPMMILLIPYAIVVQLVVATTNLMKRRILWQLVLLISAIIYMYLVYWILEARQEWFAANASNMREQIMAWREDQWEWTPLVRLRWYLQVAIERELYAGDHLLMT